jgi:hypothetical protein
MGLTMESLFQRMLYSPFMGDAASKSDIVCCPLCGKQLSDSPTEEIHNCPICGFDLLLVRAPQELSVPVTVPAYIPSFTVWSIILQMILAAIFGVLFLFFASPLYYPISVVFAGIHLVSIGILLLCAWALRREIAIPGLKIGLVVLGCVTLPLGTLSIAAAMAIAPLRRWCYTCRRSLRWSSYIECPHCKASMHSLGRCRQNQFHHIADLLDYVPSQSEIEQICTHCLKVMSAQDSWRDSNE